MGFKDKLLLPKAWGGWEVSGHMKNLQEIRYIQESCKISISLTFAIFIYFLINYSQIYFIIYVIH